MATNSARGNPSKLDLLLPKVPQTSLTGPSSVAATAGPGQGADPPPTLAADTKNKIASTTQQGAHASGTDASGAPKVKTEKERA